MNSARPSAVLSTDLVLKREQVEELKQRWQEQAKGLDGCGPGGTPILTAGLKVLPWGAIGRDVQLAEMMKMSTEQIALAFRIPLQILGIAGGATFSSTETLMNFWLSTSLGFTLNHIEEEFGRLFQLDGQPDEYLELSTDVLLRSAFKDRIEGLARGVQGGIYSPNEARNKEGLDDTPEGDEPRVQQQLVPLSAAAAIPHGPPKPFGSTGPHPPAAPAPGASPPAPPAPKDQKADVNRSVERVLRRADRYDRAAL
jgi:HK97 family phage portal protein